MERCAQSSRRFRLGDLMVMVVATGVGLALLRPYLDSFNGPAFEFMDRKYLIIEKIYGVWSCLVACWMMALLVLQYSRPHPRRGRLARRPGHVACCSAAVAMVVGGLHAVVRASFLSPNAMPYSTFYTLWITVSVNTPLAIAGAWVLLALSGRWRSDPGWMDRLGRFLGCCWLGWSLFWMIPSPIRFKIAAFWEGVLWL